MPSVYESRPLNKNRLAEYRRGRIYDLYSKGLHPIYIGKRLGMSGNSVWKIVKSEYGSVRPYDKYDDIELSGEASTRF